MKRAKKLGLEKHPLIKGAYIGFPADLKPKKYLEYIKKEVIPNSKGVLKELHGCMKEAWIKSRKD